MSLWTTGWTISSLVKRGNCARQNLPWQRFGQTLVKYRNLLRLTGTVSRLILGRSHYSKARAHTHRISLRVLLDAQSVRGLLARRTSLAGEIRACRRVSACQVLLFIFLILILCYYYYKTTTEQDKKLYSYNYYT